MRPTPIDLTGVPTVETIVEPGLEPKSVIVRECKRVDDVPYYLEVTIRQENIADVARRLQRTVRPNLPPGPAGRILYALDKLAGDRELTDAEMREVVIAYARPILDASWRWFRPTKV